MKYVLVFLSLSFLVWGGMTVYYHQFNGVAIMLAGIGGLVVWYLITRPPKMGE
jgi:hypothetical protein